MTLHSLTISRGQRELRRQVGNIPFTHIAKFPSPEVESITLAEWLPLTLLKQSGFNVARNQLVSYDNDYEVYSDEMGGEKTAESPLMSFDDSNHDMDEFDRNLFNDLTEIFAKQSIPSKKQVPPFLISERFDIPMSNQLTGEVNTSRLMSLDLASLTKVCSSQKYSLSFEDVALRLKESLPKENLKQIMMDIYLQIIGSYLVHNNDLHLKNITLLSDENTITGETTFKVSPIYDVIITPLVFPDLKDGEVYHQALTISGTLYPTVQDLFDLATQHFELDSDTVQNVFNNAITNMGNAVNNMRKSMPLDIVSRPIWNDTIRTGLAIIERNLQHIHENGSSYGSRLHGNNQFLHDNAFKR